MDWTQIILATIGLINAILVAFVVPVIKNKYSQQKLQEVNSIIKTFVMAADQIFLITQGKEKKEWVKEKLVEAGIDADVDIIDAQIEAYVLEIRKQLNVE